MFGAECNWLCWFQFYSLFFSIVFYTFLSFYFSFVYRLSSGLVADCSQPLNDLAKKKFVILKHRDRQQLRNINLRNISLQPCPSSWMTSGTWFKLIPSFWTVLNFYRKPWLTANNTRLYARQLCCSKHCPRYLDYSQVLL